MHRLMGIDPSLTAFGIAWGNADRRGLDLESVKTTTIRAESVTDLAREFSAIVNDVQPTGVIYEQARRDIALYGKKGLLPGQPKFVTPNASQLVLLEVQGLIIGITLHYGASIMAAAPNTWRKQILGRGDMDRATAKAAAKAHVKSIGIKAKSVDAAEAVCILEYGAYLPTLRFTGEW